jgi:hypothetical protein
MVSGVYEKNGEYQEAKDILLKNKISVLGIVNR